MGKTYCAVKFVLNQLETDKNLKVITNVKSFYNSCHRTLYRDRVFYSNDIYNIIDITTRDNFTSWLVFYDEIFTILDKTKSLTKRFRTYCSQLRKRKILFVTTVQEWADVNLSFRRFVRFHIVPRMYPLPLTRNAYIIKDINDGDQIHWDNDLQDFVAPLIETQISKGNVDIIKMYDTFETIDDSSNASS